MQISTGLYHSLTVPVPVQLNPKGAKAGLDVEASYSLKKGKNTQREEYEKKPNSLVVEKGTNNSIVHLSGQWS